MNIYNDIKVFRPKDLSEKLKRLESKVENAEFMTEKIESAEKDKKNKYKGKVNK